MTEKRFELDINDEFISIIDNGKKIGLNLYQAVDLLNEYEIVLDDTQTFAVNLCKFLMEKGLDDEFREKYGDKSLNFKMSNAIYGDGI